MSQEILNINQKINTIVGVAASPTVGEDDALKLIGCLTNINDITKNLQLPEQLSDEIFTTLAVALV